LPGTISGPCSALLLQAPRAEALGFASDTAIDEVIQAFIEDDLAMQKQLV
jgi:hypothetical protein